MRKMNIVTGAGMAALIFLWPAFSWGQFDLWNAEDYNIELEGRYWKPKLDATVKIVDNNRGSDVNLVNDLGFDERKDFGEARLQIKFLGRHKFNFSYLPLKWDGDQFLIRAIQFNGQTFSVGSRVQSQLDIKLFKGGYEYDLIVGKYGFFGATFDVLVANNHFEVKAPALAIDVKHDATVPIPMIGLIARLNILKWLGLTAKVSGLPMGGYGYALDAAGSLDINPIKFVGISGGYRFLRVQAAYQDNSADYQLDGPFVALKIRF